MEELKQIKDILVDQVQNQMRNLHGVNAKELGEVIDMIKDLAETMYYCSIVQAMEKGSYSGEYDKENSLFYGGNMGYSSSSTGNGSSSNQGNNARGYYDAGLFRNYEGRSPMSRRMYMESKANGQNTEAQVHELENYMQELTQDLSEMIQSASPEEKQLLQRKIGALATKLQNV